MHGVEREWMGREGVDRGVRGRGGGSMGGWGGIYGVFKKRGEKIHVLLVLLLFHFLC